MFYHKDVYEKIKAEALTQVRGTVQADILKEDQAQNTCIFSTEFALKLMGDVQEYFINQKVRNFYSVSYQWLSYCRSRCKSYYTVGIYTCPMGLLM